MPRQNQRGIIGFLIDLLLPRPAQNTSGPSIFGEVQGDRPWQAIFRNEEWIQKALEVGASPALISPKLDMIGSLSCHGSRRHVLLVTNDRQGNLVNYTDLLFQSLRPGYAYDKAKFTITLPKTIYKSQDNRDINIPEIVLYVRDAIHPWRTTILSKRTIRRVFENRSVQTQYCFACEREFRVLRATQVFGIGGKISEPGALIPICVLHLLCDGKSWQIILKAPDCPRVSPIYMKGTRDLIVGWDRL